jgi:hypothetical protein
MVRAKRMGSNGLLHWLPGPLAYRAVCGVLATSGDWMPIRDDAAGIWGECKRCAAIRAKAGEK